jgi:prepilin-type N-terminal cleavage/methylation domain-containing protein
MQVGRLGMTGVCLKVCEEFTPLKTKRVSRLIGSRDALSGAGFTLIEVMLAVAIIAITVIGTPYAYVLSRRFVVNQRYSRTAVQLAAQKIETLRAAGYDGIAGSIPEEKLTMAGQSYLRRTRVSLTATPTASVPKPCKELSVTVLWSGGTNQRQVTLAAYIGP